MKTFWLEGGIGKHVMFTAMIDELHKKYGKFNVLSAYPDVFKGNPKIKKAYSLDNFMEDPRFTRDNDVVYTEPYKSNFVFEKERHLLEFWTKQLGIKHSKDMKPNIVSRGIFKIDAKKIADDINKEHNGFIILQFTGGQSPYEMSNPNGPAPYGQNPMINQRNYPHELVVELVEKIQKEYPDLKILMYSLPNEHPEIPGTERLNLEYMTYVELLRYAKTFVSIDSSLSHMATAVDKKGIVLWGGISYPEFGWDMHVNLTNYRGEYGEKGNFDPNNPHYIKVPTDTIMEEFNKIMEES